MQHTTTINGVHYSTIEFGFIKGLPLACKVGALTGVPLGKLLTGELIDLDVDLKLAEANEFVKAVNLGQLAEDVFQRLLDHNAAELIVDLLSQTRAQIGDSDRFEDLTREIVDTRFAGLRALEAFRVAAWVVSVNWLPLSGSRAAAFSGLFTELGERLAGLIGGEAQSTNTGTPFTEPPARRRSPRPSKRS